MPASNRRFRKSGGVVLKNGCGKKRKLYLCGGSCETPAFAKPLGRYVKA